MDPVKFRRIAGIVILIISLALLVWGLWPYADQVRSIDFYPTEMQLPDVDGLHIEIMWFL